MASGMGLRLVALPGLRVVGRHKACIYICAVPVLNGCWAKISAEAIIGVVACAVHVQCQISKRTICDTEIVASASATEASIRIKDCGLIERYARSYVLSGGQFVPVRLCPGIVALGLQEDLVRSHVQSVPRQKRPSVVDHICLYNMRIVKLVPPRDCALDRASLWRRADEA